MPVFSLARHGERAWLTICSNVPLPAFWVGFPLRFAMNPPASGWHTMLRLPLPLQDPPPNRHPHRRPSLPPSRSIAASVTLTPLHLHGRCRRHLPAMDVGRIICSDDCTPLWPLCTCSSLSVDSTSLTTLSGPVHGEGGLLDICRFSLSQP
jgi:hypothetical protein